MNRLGSVAGPMTDALFLATSLPHDEKKRIERENGSFWYIANRSPTVHRTSHSIAIHALLSWCYTYPSLALSSHHLVLSPASVNPALLSLIHFQPSLLITFLFS